MCLIKYHLEYISYIFHAFLKYFCVYPHYAYYNILENINRA